MAHFHNIPENVMIQHLLPHLNHNDILRVRRVSPQTKAYADTYLWTPKPGHQGKWELKINSRRQDQTLQAFLQLGLPPPSKLYIANETEHEASEEGSFFEDDHLEEFMGRYSKYVTHLRIDKLFLPFTSAKEIRFYESLTNLEFLSCNQIKTVGGAAQFERKTRNAEGSFLLRPTFRKLRSLNLGSTDCLDSMWNFINGVSDNLEEMLHPFEKENADGVIVDNDDNGAVIRPSKLAPVQELIERRGGKKLVYDWRYFCHIMSEPLELLRLFAVCRDNGVIIKNLQGCALHCLLCDETGRIDRAEVRDPETWEMGWRVNYERNLFVGSIIKSLIGVVDTVFLLDLPALEEIQIRSADRCSFRIRQRRGGNEYPQWPALKKMNVYLDEYTEEHLHYFCGRLMLPQLEQLSLNYFGSFRKMRQMPFPRSMDLVNCCGNLKKLALTFCSGNTNFYVGLWEGLPLLEEVHLESCWRLKDKGFVGNGGRPVFLMLEKLKHLTLSGLENMPKITDAAFRNVFRHLKLSSLELRDMDDTGSITLAGIKELLTGPFAETIEKLTLERVYFHGVSRQQLKEVESLFRSSKML